MRKLQGCFDADGVHSNYKSHTTIKALIGITPYSSISRVSELYSGRVSDVELTKICGFYQHSKSGDVIMADRGFTIKKELQAKGASLVIAHFKKRKKQLPGPVVALARTLCTFRIHVERATDLIKTFALFHKIISVTLIPSASDMLIICAALVGLRPRLQASNSDFKEDTLMSFGAGSFQNLGFCAGTTNDICED